MGGGGPTLSYIALFRHEIDRVYNGEKFGLNFWLPICENGQPSAVALGLEPNDLITFCERCNRFMFALDSALKLTRVSLMSLTLNVGLDMRIIACEPEPSRPKNNAHECKCVN